MRQLTGWRVPLEFPPLAWAACLAVAGVWIGHGLRPWVDEPAAWLALGVACGSAGLLWARRGLPGPVRHPARAQGFRAGGGLFVPLCLAVSTVSLAAGHYLLHAHGLEEALPSWLVGEAGMPAPERDELGGYRIGSHPGGPVSVIGEVVEEPQATRSGGARFVLRAQWGAPRPPEEARPAEVSPAPEQGWLPLSGFPLLQVYVAPPPPGGPYPPFDAKAGERLELRGFVRYPRLPRHPGGFSERDFLHSRGISGVMTVPHVRHARILELPPDGSGARDGGVLKAIAGGLLHLARTWRRQVEDSLRSGLPPGQGDLLVSMLFGDRHGLSQELQEDFQRAGVVHLLAVSGLHVGFVGGVTTLMVRLLRLPRAPGIAIAGLTVLLYVLATGARPPGVRAGVVVLLGALAHAMGRWRDMPVAAAVGALLLVAYRPHSALDLSFQLSFAAALAIWAFGRALPVRDERREEPGILLYSLSSSGRFALLAWLKEGLRLGATAVGSGLVVSGAALAGTAPLLWRTFGEVSLLGLVGNVVAVPLAGILVPFALAGGTVGLIPGLHGVQITLLKLTAVAASALECWTRAIAALPVAPVTVAAPGPAFFLLWYGTLIALAVLVSPGAPRLHLRRVDWHVRRLPAVRGLALVLSLALVAVCLVFPTQKGRLEIYFFDVGQGASALIRTPQGRALLIDGGWGREGREETDGFDAGRRVILPSLRALGVKKLDVVVNTHPHEDHLGGLLDVLEALPVAAVFDSGQEAGDGTYRRYRRLIETKRIIHRSLRRGDIVHVEPELYLEVLHPPVPLLAGTRDDLNNNSLVLRLSYRDVSWLFTGDIEKEGEVDLLQSRLAPRLRADGLQIPHHGAASSYWRPFWDAVLPRFAVIQVGRNAFGQPADEVLTALDERRTRVFRTDRDGTVRLWTRGQKWEMSM